MSADRVHPPCSAKETDPAARCISATTSTTTVRVAGARCGPVLRTMMSFAPPARVFEPMRGVAGAIGCGGDARGGGRHNSGACHSYRAVEGRRADATDPEICLRRRNVAIGVRGWPQNPELTTTLAQPLLCARRNSFHADRISVIRTRRQPPARVLMLLDARPAPIDARMRSFMRTGTCRAVFLAGAEVDPRPESWIVCTRHKAPQNSNSVICFFAELGRRSACAIL